MALVHCREDYCNALLAATAGKTSTIGVRILRLEVSVDRRTPTSHNPHQFYTASTGADIVVWKCIHGVGSAYLHELCVPVENVRGRLRVNVLFCFLPIVLQILIRTASICCNREQFVFLLYFIIMLLSTK